MFRAKAQSVNLLRCSTAFSSSVFVRNRHDDLSDLTDILYQPD
jgi:hypothetical protein